MEQLKLMTEAFCQITDLKFLKTLKSQKARDKFIAQMFEKTHRYIVHLRSVERTMDNNYWVLFIKYLNLKNIKINNEAKSIIYECMNKSIKHRYTHWKYYSTDKHPKKLRSDINAFKKEVFNVLDEIFIRENIDKENTIAIELTGVLFILYDIIGIMIRHKKSYNENNKPVKFLEYEKTFDETREKLLGFINGEEGVPIGDVNDYIKDFVKYIDPIHRKASLGKK